MQDAKVLTQLVDFSNKWESFLTECKEEAHKKGEEGFNLIKNHKAHDTVKVLKEKAVSELYKIVNEKFYKVDYSVGKGVAAGIPWIAIMDKSITTSATEKFYITFLFSRNAKKVYLSITLAATQFADLFGKNSKTLVKIEKARDLWQKQFKEYSPSEQYDDIDLLNENDSTFIRDITKNIKWRADSFMAGSFFTKEFDLKEESAENKFNDLIKSYISCYKKILDNPLSLPLFDNLDELVADPIEMERLNYNYELPIFSPTRKPSSNNKKQKKASKIGIKTPYSPVSKKVGEKGEEYVYQYERNKLINNGLKELAEKVYKQCEDKSNYPGYDIKSYDVNGDEIYIEVKSTKTKKKEYFEISRNEYDAAKRLGNKYYIYHVTDTLKSPKITNVIRDPYNLNKQGYVSAEPMMYKFIFASD